MLGSSLVAAQLAASQEGLSSVSKQAFVERQHQVQPEIQLFLGEEDRTQNLLTQKLLQWFGHVKRFYRTRI
jgi:predicted lipid-binding transport protein (Tim44 family)